MKNFEKIKKNVAIKELKKNDLKKIKGGGADGDISNPDLIDM